jgi:Tol biopolymer transport system component
VNTANGEERCVEGLDATDPDFAPAGSSIVFAAPISGQAEIWKAEVQDDGTLTNYTQLTRGPADQPSRDPAFSSNGNWVVFARDTDPGAGEAFRLFVVRNDGQGLRPLELPGTDPTWLGGGSAPSLPDLPNKTYLPMVQRH